MGTRKRWFAFTLVALGFLASNFITQKTTTDISVPNTPSAMANQVLQTHFHENIEGTFTILLHFKNAPVTDINHMKATISKASKVIPHSQMLGQSAIGGWLISTIQSDLSLTAAARHTPALRNSLESLGVNGALVTGPPAINFDLTPRLRYEFYRSEIIAVFGAFIILMLYFRKISIAFDAVLTALATSGSCAIALYLLSFLLPMVVYVPNIALLLAFGLSLDYSLLILSRSGVHEELNTAQRTILNSALIVSVSLGSLLLFPIPFIRSLGASSIAVPLIGACLAPYLLSGIECDFRQRRNYRLPRKRLLVIFATAGILIVSSLLGIGAELTSSTMSKLPPGTESTDALAEATRSIGIGVLTPIEIILNRSSDRTQVLEELHSIPHVVLIGSGVEFPFQTEGVNRIIVFGTGALGSRSSAELVKSILDLHLPALIGGAPVQSYDLLKSTKRQIWLVVPILFVTIGIGLTLILRSFFIPTKAILLAGLSTVSTFGISTWVLDALHSPLEIWVLIFACALLFAFAMDYEIFLISRIREKHLQGFSDDLSIEAAMREIFPVISAGALGIIVAVSGFIFSNFVGMKELGLYLITGVIIDATVIRYLLLPSVMSLLGRFNWY